ncbi:CGNR zinc finger domain-containing protein [Streptoalloteichus tenebrarius]|uniref:CGNR zinc finger domain-containing protein n=1 Tax=Streptoalloteichus tenebrarius (strain ATCC 17920 / DSM 40477 / JCM 4838 / CBS 697.72 / NBRC 16177 / NCIMB 11028 / NRRL B-12390 / A12253. 1 / ISP 5477) TaxID=1933 RepID=A0ABT1HR83_STRSD|nr:CGNR zinc finger domain-containing protein [Streptoalloteichus tenebrarius]MCP2258013.1 CGNR zinc finger domain-containing protein [Streptoalloteichus tenebrarius]BFF01681.1 CGNR zinc finger domain-containing protein [Streptoalloteichus tenebrarius]
MGAPSTAPGALEQVRTFLNTWRIPNDTRQVQDQLPELVADHRAWAADLPDVPPPTDLGELLDLRTALRAALGETHPSGLDDWLVRHPVVARVGDAEPPVVHRPVCPDTTGELLALVVDAIQQRRWARLKACPDCQWVFYDHSRNASRTWCGMYAESAHGRACGSIAKVRAYRARKAQGNTA